MGGGSTLGRVGRSLASAGLTALTSLAALLASCQQTKGHQLGRVYLPPWGRSRPVGPETAERHPRRGEEGGGDGIVPRTSTPAVVIHMELSDTDFVLFT